MNFNGMPCSSDVRCSFKSASIRSHKRTELFVVLGLLVRARNTLNATRAFNYPYSSTPATPLLCSEARDPPPRRTMAPLSLITALFLAATNLTTNLSITLLTPSSTGFLSISSGELKCPNSTVLYSGDLLPLVVDYTYTPSYDPSQPWNGTIPANDAPQGSFDRNGTAEFALKDLKGGWVRFVVQDNTKAEAYSVPYQLRVGSKGVDGCT